MTDRFERIATFYDALVGRYGHDPRAADYGRAESQRTKFEVLAAALRPEDRTLLDVGCGFADYARFLRDQNIDIAYTGIDLSPKMLAEAKRAQPTVALRVANVLDDIEIGPFDVVSANGIFYLLGEDAWQITQTLIARMFSLCRRMASFTTLSTWAPDPSPGEFYVDPGQLLAFCQTLSPRVALRHDYHHRDMAIFLYR